MSSAGAPLSLVEQESGADPVWAHSPAVPGGRVARRIVFILGAAVTIVGLVLGLFCLFVFAGSNVVGARGQKELLASFKQALDASATAPAAAPALTVAPGRPLGVLRIPSLGLEVLLLEGTRPADLEKGPGHLRGTPLPGRGGNVVVAGRRATYGAAFRRLDELERGDKIAISTLRGLSTYAVTGKKIAGPGDPDVIGRTTDSRLTLVTSHPEYIANRRLAVTAKLQGDTRAQAPEAGPLVIGREESGLAGDTSAAGPMILWAELLAAAVAAAWLAYRRWPRRAMYLVTTPIILALMYVLFIQISRLLPSTL